MLAKRHCHILLNFRDLFNYEISDFLSYFNKGTTTKIKVKRLNDSQVQPELKNTGYNF